MAEVTVDISDGLIARSDSGRFICRSADQILQAERTHP